MLLEIRNIKQSVKQPVEIATVIAKKLMLPGNAFVVQKVLKKSLDARRKDDIYYVWSVVIEVEDAMGKNLVDEKNIFPYQVLPKASVEYGTKKIENRPIIVGSGPAGLFAGLILAENGYKPLILEQGYDVDKRSAVVDALREQGQFDPISNIQFGEGGAGTFSDGKLTTRIKDKRGEVVLDKLIENGAVEEIKYIYKPHIGTDGLKDVVKNMRNRIIMLGGEVRFEAKVTDIIIEKQKIKAVIVNEQEKIESNVVAFAIGHSARDTYKMLYERGVQMTSKAFSIGVRIEHLQSMINKVQYGSEEMGTCLGAADYQLSHKSTTTGRTAYSFCMCPGGTVVPAASESGMLVVNGMSEFARDQANANSAIVVSVSPEDYGSEDPMAAIEYQRKWEKLAFQVAGENYHAPVQLVGDFLKDKPSTKLFRVKPSYLPGIKFVEVKEYLPQYVVETLREGLLAFDKKIKGFASHDAVLTGVETRTSSPVRMNREENMQAVEIEGLYPLGEGAGYAGGIVSAAVDGIRWAEEIMQSYALVK